ncbi:MAG: NADP-dependent malic enzyme [Thermonemataceae bacterium]|nr:NADP-dependent malic enzyme [Thermonemataceae bacterium]
MSIKVRKEEALHYHSKGKPGKIEVIPTKPLISQIDLALAYSPGVAEPCKEIAANVEEVYKYTAKGNLVAVISNGTAVLGLGDIGAEASKPVMEGKGVLFKKFAGIDVFDIEINEKDPKKFIQIVKSLEPTFGGINLEDIKAPECFEIEQTLREEMHIPIMHDDQHGTAIVTSAALLGALEIIGKKIDEIKVVVNGAGASAISCTNLYLVLGVKKENLVMLDSKGVIRKDRENLDESKAFFATERDIYSLDDAMKEADMFLGLSKGNVVSPEMLLTMAENPIVFACANPDPEIAYDLAIQTRPDVIMATGRSDHPNQVNNVLGFPYIFRGALDVRATKINEAMKLAAVHAIANLTKQPVPDEVKRTYNRKDLKFGKEYILPKPIDPRLITTIAPAVAKAAMDSGVAKHEITDWEEYKEFLNEKLGIDQKLMSNIIHKAKANPKKIVFAEGDHQKILRAAQTIRDEGIATPILLGNKAKILSLIKEHSLDLQDCPIIDPLDDAEDGRVQEFAKILYEERQRKGMTMHEARKLMHERHYFGSMLVKIGEADAFISGMSRDFAKAVRPPLQVIGGRAGELVAAMGIVISQGKTIFFADVAVNEQPTVEELVEIVGLVKKGVEFFGIEPHIALGAYSSFGAAKGNIPSKMQDVLAICREKYRDLVIDGEIQPHIALNEDLLKEVYPFSILAEKECNTIVFPGISSGNISFNLVQQIGKSDTIGPILLGMNKPIHILQLGCSVSDIVNMAAIAVVDAQAE